MPLPPRLLRYTRKAAHSLGLVDPSCAALARDVADLIDQRAPELIAAHRVPGLSLHVSLADASTVERCYGVADTATGTPMTPAHVFQVISISKPVTAFGVMRLAEQGLLDLDAPVSTYLRSWTLPHDRRHNHSFDHVTLRRILSHSAGLNVHGFLWATPGTPPPTTAQLLDGVEGPDFLLRLLHPPGERLLYSGGGFTLIQLIIEDVTGRPFADVMRDEVLTPLGMTSSSYVETDVIRARLATRHDAHGTPLARALCAAHAPTGLYSTPRDLAKLWTAMYKGPHAEPPGRGFISPTLAKQMTTPHTDPTATRVCGLGFFLWLKRSDTVFSHAGFKQGWWSQVDGLLNRRCTIAACSNADTGAECVKALCAEIRQHLFDHAI